MFKTSLKTKLQLLTGSLALAVLISVIINIWQYTIISNFRLRPASVPSDQPYIKKAASYWGQKNGTTTSKAMAERYGKVIFFGGQVCVSLDLDAGGVGGVPVYCFDEHTGQLKHRYDEVE